MKLCMYVVINEDLKMNAGKVAANSSHAVFDLTHKIVNDEYNAHSYLDEWVEASIAQNISKVINNLKVNGDSIVILRASEEEMIKFESEGFITVREEKTNRITAVNLGIYDKDIKVPEMIESLKLY